VKVIIEAAINGATRKSTNPNVPISAEEIAADAIACLDAGAAIIHNHIPLTSISGEEAATAYLEAWRVVLSERPDALWYPTANFGPHEHWYSHIPPLASSGLLRMTLCDPGSVNLGAERDGLPAGSFVYANSFNDVAHQLALCHEHALAPSIAIYEPGWLRTVLAYQRAGQLPAGAWIKLYMSSDRGISGTAFGLPPTMRALEAYLELLDGTDLPWAISVPGGDVIAGEICRPALAAGGHLHVGLEFFGGDRTPTNVELVQEAVRACEAAGRPVASCTDAAAILGMPGS